MVRENLAMTGALGAPAHYSGGRNGKVQRNPWP